MEKMYQPEDKWFVDGDLKLHYLDWGNPGAVPMLLLHPHAANAHNWDFFAQSMRTDYHVLAWDQRGCGDSSWMSSYGHEEYVADLTKLIDNLGLNGIVLIGHSVGGVNAIVYTAAHPDRVARLVIVDIGPKIDTAGMEQSRRRMPVQPEAFDSEEEAVRYMQQTQPNCSEDIIRHTVKHALKRDESGRLIYKFDPALNQSRVDTGSMEALWQELAKIVCPTLVMRGAESMLLLPEVARQMVETLPSGVTVEIEHAGHGIPSDNPEAFEAAVRQFLGDYGKQSG